MPTVAGMIQSFFPLAGFPPSGQGYFVSAKGPKTISALERSFGYPAKVADPDGGAPRSA